MAPLIVFVVALALWNGLGGLLAAHVPLARYVRRAANRARARAADRLAKRDYLRWVAANHLWNLVMTAGGSLALTIGAVENGVAPWLGWGIFGVYFVFTRLRHIADAATRLVRAEAMPMTASI
jgi:predicted membrane-bound spermidine synthase